MFNQTFRWCPCMASLLKHDKKDDDGNFGVKKKEFCLVWKRAVFEKT